MANRMSPVIEIGERRVGAGFPTFLIAEAGVNHNGDIKLAKELVDLAADCDVDAVKFQTFRVGELIIEDAGKALYQWRASDPDESQATMLRRLEMPDEFFVEVAEYSAGRGILFLSTPYDAPSLKTLLGLGVPAVKVSSTDSTNLLFLEQIAASGKPVILSTGMTKLPEIERSVSCLRENGASGLAILKCTSNYPARLDHVNLRAMATLGRRFDAVVGFSDHTVGVGASPAAVALGASIVEKHFTLDRSMAGPDHQASLGPEEFRDWVRACRDVETMLGQPAIAPSAAEGETRRALQRSLVARHGLDAGQILDRSMLAAKRTGGVGVAAGDLYTVLGKRLSRAVNRDQPIDWGSLEP